MSVSIQNTKISKAYIGNSNISKIYIGSTLIYPSIITNNLLLYFDAGNTTSYPGSGTTWYDLENTNNATLYNGVSYTSTNGGLLNFDGINDYGQTPILNLTTFTGFTVEIWIRYNTSNSNVGQLFSYGRTFGAANVGTIIHSTGSPGNGFYALVSSGTGTYDYLGAAGITGLSNATPYQLAWTYNSNGDVCGYTNGSQVVCDNLSGWSGFNVASTFFVRLAQDVRYSIGSRHYLGGIYIVRVYTTTLSSTEISQNFNVDRSRFGI